MAVQNVNKALRTVLTPFNGKASNDRGSACLIVLAPFFPTRQMLQWNFIK